MLTQMPLRLKYFFMAIFAGCLYALGFPNEFIPVLVVGPIFGLGLLFHLLDIDHSKKIRFLDRAFILLAFSLGYSSFGFYWIPHTLKEFGGLSAPWNYFLGTAFSLIIVPQYWIFLITLHWYNKRARFLRIPHPWLKHIVFALILTTLEYVVPQQFPAHPGHSWMGMAPHLSLAPIGGAPLFSFMSYWLAFCVRQPLKQKQDWWGVACGLVFVFVNALFPLRLQQDPNQNLKIRIVQPNIGNFMKLDSERGGRDSIEKVFASYEQLSLHDRSPVDLIIWPETAYPSTLLSGLMKKHYKLTPKLMRDIIDRTGAEMVIGGYDRNPNSPGNFMGEYNAAFHIGLDGKLKDVYRKQLLIPFGEGLPFGPLNKPLSKVLSNVSFFAAGEEFPIFNANNGFSFASIICYEALFSPFIADYLNSNEARPDFILNLTNDSWYGDTSEPYQHLFLAKWRAVEFAIPMVRSTNTGVSSVVYADGSESAQTGVFEETVLQIELAKSTSKSTLFQRFGIWITWFIAICLSASIFLATSLTRKSLSH